MSASNAKPTVNDVARVAGVSLATVDRVLNERSGVRSITIDKVHNAVEHLGYVRDTAAANLARQRSYRLVFILPDTDNGFVLALQRELAEQSARLKHERTIIECICVSPFDPAAVVEALDRLHTRSIDGVAVFGPASPAVDDAVQRVSDLGIAVVALVADQPESACDHFVGIDNVAAGRTAAKLLGRFMAGNGQILVITGSHLASDHVERVKGFEEVIATEFPALEVVASIEGHDDSDVVEDLLPSAFTNYPDISGIYSAAAGNRGLIRHLQQTGRHNDFMIVAHELTDNSRAALRDGIFDAVISQDSGHLVRSATRVLKATADRIAFDQTQERIRIDIYLRENMPAQISEEETVS